MEWEEKEEEDTQNNQSSSTRIPSNIVDSTPPDPGFLQTAVEESDIQDVIEIIELSDVETELSVDESNMFLDLETIENPTPNPPPLKKCRNISN